MNFFIPTLTHIFQGDKLRFTICIKNLQIQDKSPMLVDLHLLSRTSQGDHDAESSINLGNLRFFNRFLQGV